MLTFRLRFDSPPLRKFGVLQPKSINQTANLLETSNLTQV
jgi:hypothetical protein